MVSGNIWNNINKKRKKKSEKTWVIKRQGEIERHDYVQYDE